MDSEAVHLILVLIYNQVNHVCRFQMIIVGHLTQVENIKVLLRVTLTNHTEQVEKTLFGLAEI